jgi:hypothetical protein
MKTIIAKNEGRNMYQVTVMQEDFDPWKMVPYGKPHPDTIHEYPDWQTKQQMSAIASEWDAQVLWG